MAFNIRKYKLRNQVSSGNSRRMNIVGTRSISVNGKKVRAGIPKGKNRYEAPPGRK